MRHGKKFNKLSRTAAHRKAMLANMASSLIEHKRINTTVAKAKALRGYIEPLITKSKDDSTQSRRTVFSYLQDKNAVSELFREVAPKVAQRAGGYTRILKTGTRMGDAADMCFIELVDFNDTYVREQKAKKSRRSRRGGKKAEGTTATPKAAETAAVEETKAEVVEETKAEVSPAASEEKNVAEVKETEETKEKPSAETTPETKAKTEKAEKVEAEDKKKAPASEEAPKAETKKAAEVEEKEEDTKNDNKEEGEKKSE